jgi:hypothetical protein
MMTIPEHKIKFKIQIKKRGEEKNVKKLVAVLIILFFVSSCLAVGMTFAKQDKTQGNDQKRSGAEKKADLVVDGLSNMEDFRGAFPTTKLLTAPRLEAPLGGVSFGELSFQPWRCPSVTFDPASATIVVPTDYPTIQQAIDNASAGDTIYVYNGTYAENLIIPTNLTLIGEGRDVTVIDGRGADCIRVTAADVEIKGFTIYNGSAGIYVEADDATITVFNNNISGNANGGVQINASNRIVANITCNVISANGCDCGWVLTGGGIRMYVNASDGTINATIRDNNIEWNRCGGIRLGWWGASQGMYGGGPLSYQRVCGDITAIIDNNIISNNRDGSIRIKALDTIDATVTSNYIVCIEETRAGGLVRIGFVSANDDDDPSEDYAYPTTSVTATISGNTIECGNYSDNVNTGGMIRILANETINATVNDNYLHGGYNIGGVIRIGWGGWGLYEGSYTKDVAARVINNTLNFASNLTAGDWPNTGGLIRIVAQNTIDAAVNENRIFGSGNTGGVIHIGYKYAWAFPLTKEVTAAVIGNYLDCGNASDEVNIGGFIRIVANDTINATVNDNYLRGGYYIGGGIRIGHWGSRNNYEYLPTTNVTARVINNTLNFTDYDDLGGAIWITAQENLDTAVNENRIYGNNINPTQSGQDLLAGGGIRIGWLANAQWPSGAPGPYPPCRNVTATVNDNAIAPCNGGAIRIMANDTLDATVMNNSASGNKGSGIRIGFFCWDNLNYSTPIVRATVVNNTVTNNNGSGIHVSAQDNLTLVMFGNTLVNNTYCNSPRKTSEYVASGSGLYVEGESEFAIHFNNFDGNSEYGLLNGNLAETVDARHNWWGSSDGPHASPGSGDNVSANITYEPWLGAPLVLPAVLHEALGAGADQEVDASAEADTKVTVTTTGETELYVAKYASQPFPEEPFPGTALGKYIDILATDPDKVTWPVYVELSYTDAEVAAAGVDESALGLYYYKPGNTFHRCSNTGVNTEANYIWANVTETEAGALAGKEFGAGSSNPSERAPILTPLGLLALLGLLTLIAAVSIVRKREGK